MSKVERAVAALRHAADLQRQRLPMATEPEVNAVRKAQAAEAWEKAVKAVAGVRAPSGIHRRMWNTLIQSVGADMSKFNEPEDLANRIYEFSELIGDTCS